MEILLKEFKEKFYSNLLEIHWRHWAAFGVASHVKPERYWIIDLESLILSTLAIGLHDKRLLSSSLEWLIKNGEWMNLSRLKRIMKVFAKTFPGSKEPLILPEIIELLVDTYNKNARNKIAFKKIESYAFEENNLKEYRSIFNNFRIRNIVTEPKLRHSSMLQLLLRAIFGIDAHVEILIYLLVKGSGNSNSIAKEIFYNQKNVYSLLERWTHAQMVTKIPENKAGYYSLNRKKELLAVIGFKETPNYLNWTKTFLFFDQVSKALSTSPWSEDEYLLSSLFRDLLDEIKPMARFLNIKIPEATIYPGKQYFAPFASGILSVLKKLTKHG